MERYCCTFGKGWFERFLFWSVLNTFPILFPLFNFFFTFPYSSSIYCDLQQPTPITILVKGIIPFSTVIRSISLRLAYFYMNLNYYAI